MKLGNCRQPKRLLIELSENDSSRTKCGSWSNDQLLFFIEVTGSYVQQTLTLK
ncbi:hypothetical protein JOC55_006544 [Paenibacillus sacheonensis]|nr:hypothetical protein [Paenibacillus sacheonensis]